MSKAVIGHTYLEGKNHHQNSCHLEEGGYKTGVRSQEDYRGVYEKKG
jgi:hypothetical protein